MAQGSLKNKSKLKEKTAVWPKNRITLSCSVESPNMTDIPSLDADISKARALAYFTDILSDQVTTLQVIGEALREIDAALDQAQPGHSGRIRVMWVSRGKSRGWLDERIPQAVAWHRSRGGHWKATRLPVPSLAKRVKRTGDFEQNAPQVMELVRRLAGLLTLHAEVRSRLARWDGHWSQSRPHVSRRLDDLRRI